MNPNRQETLLCTGRRVHQCLIALRNLGCMYNINSVRSRELFSCCVSVSNMTHDATCSLNVCLLTEGRLDVTKDGLKVFTVEPEDMFGELALLYNCTHSFSVSGIKAPSWLVCSQPCGISPWFILVEI